MLPSASSAMVEQDRFSDLQTVDDQQLGDMRGGFSVAGVNFGFGAVITTVVNGVVVLQTQLVATNEGLVPTTLQSNSLPDTTITVSSTRSGAVTRTVTISGQAGTTAAIATVDGQKVVNAVISNASYQNVSQQIQVNVQLNNFTSVANQIRQDQLATQVAGTVDAALLAGVPH